MVKKGKFKLLSYLIDDYLIFYKSLNRNKKIVAFSILETESYHLLITILNRFLNQRFINYYSIQININDMGKKVIFLNFEDKTKDSIIKLFNLINQKLNNCKSKILFLLKDQLEKIFLNIILNNSSSNIKISKMSDSILIKDEKSSTYIDIYDINLSNIDNKSTFFHNFLNLLNKLNRKGYLVINLKRDIQDNIIFTTNFVDMRNNFNSIDKFELEINKIFDYNLLEKKKCGLNNVFYLLWRFGISSDSYRFNDFSELFLDEIHYDFKDLSKFNAKFEDNLINKHIKFKRLNQNLLFIEQHSLFYTSTNLDYKLILKILKKYYLKYFIYILILNDNEYNKLLKIEKINWLKKAKMLCPEEFLNFNFNVLRNNVLLKNTQIDGDVLSRVIRM